MPASGGGFEQAYNAQAAVAAGSLLVVAADVVQAPNDKQQLEPMLDKIEALPERLGRVETLLADAGYFSKDNVATAGVETLIAPGKRDIGRQSRLEAQRGAVLERVEQGAISRADAAVELGVGRSRIDQLLLARQREIPPTPAVAMLAKLATPRGRRLYKKRGASIEPVFGQTKHNRGIRRFSRRGLTAVDSEWKLIAATHNLLKLWQHAKPALA